MTTLRPEEWVGYLEHATPDLLTVFTANVGKGGCTVFAEMIWERQRVYVQGLPWCATFVHAVIDRPDILGKAHAGTRVLERRMRRRRLWRDKGYTPERGDLIFMTNRADGRVSHCGIVLGADENGAETLEGNAVDPSGHFRREEGGAVIRRRREWDDRTLVGWAATGRYLSWR